MTVDFRQNDFEGEVVEAVHEARREAFGIVIDPAGLSLFSVSLLDALATFADPKVPIEGRSAAATTWA